jgi:glutamyl-tRNA reductase
VQRLFRDVKLVRSQHLSGIGSSSYGSMVRRLLDEDSNPDVKHRPVLLVGAGQIAHAVAPWIKGTELWIWNRSLERAQDLAVELQRRAPQRVIKVLDASSAAELNAWRNAHDVVVCVPADEQQDTARAAAWLAGGEQRGRLIHLGVDGSQPMGAWSGASRLLHLADVYRALRESNEQRRTLIERARAACNDYAAQWSQPRTVSGPGTHRSRDQRVS